VEKAGVHSGDSACALPPYSLGDDQIERIQAQARALATELGVIGLLNIQFAIKNEQVFVLEVNPRASRTVPFVSKAIGVPLAKLATHVMLGSTLRSLGFGEEREVAHIAVKEAVFPFIKFPGVDTVLGPEMKSTGEVMGIDHDFRKAYVKSQISAGSPLPTSGKVFLSVKNRDKRAVLQIAKRLAEMGFSFVATVGTAKLLQRQGMTVEVVHKVNENYRPNIVDLMKRGEIAGVVFITSKPIDAFLKGKWDEGFKFLPVDYGVKFEDYYLPSFLDAKDYPNLIGKGDKVETIAVPTILTTYNWQSGSDRYRRVSRFVEYLFNRVDRLHAPGFDGKWKDVNLNAKVPGLERFRTAQEWLNANTAKVGMRP